MIEVTKNTLTFNGKTYKCAVGKNGISVDKREGDGSTPAGQFLIRKVFYRADRVSKPNSPYETEAIERNDAWSEDVNDPQYNMHVKLPYGTTRDSLWREDNLYDIVAQLGYNDDPVIAGKGSAIFLHIARPEYTGTAGCVALSESDLREVLKQCSIDTLVNINQ